MGKVSAEEYMKFNMDIGYSLSGFCEIFGQSCDADGRDIITQVLEHHEDVLAKIVAGELDENYNWRNIETLWNDYGMDEEKEEELGGYAKLKPCPHLERRFLTRTPEEILKDIKQLKEDIAEVQNGKHTTNADEKGAD
jgi:hypothetical protein